MFEEGGFSIRVGKFDSYYIQHDACTIHYEHDGDLEPSSVAYDISSTREVIFEHYCRRCNKRYSNEMDGLITLLNWER